MPQTSLGDALERSQHIAAFYQDQFAQEKEDRQNLETALAALTKQTKQLLESEIWKKGKEDFRRLGLRVLEHFLEKALPSWDPKREPNGIHYKQIAQAFPHHDPGTVRRRLNELSRDPKKLGMKGGYSPYNCTLYGFQTPPLIWRKPGFYLPNPNFSPATEPDSSAKEQRPT